MELKNIDSTQFEKLLLETLIELGYIKESGKRQIDTEVMDTCDITSAEIRMQNLLDHPMDSQGLDRMRQRTTARIGVGRVGARLKTRTMLTLRADHAAARDAVFTDVDPGLLERLKLFSVQSRCKDKNEYLTRPDQGRLLCDEAVEEIRKKCISNPDIQIVVSEGLSSTAINANLENILPAIQNGLAGREVSVGTPFYIRMGRVRVMDHVAEILGSKVVCILIGERPGLATAESMSAYIAYNARVGMSESRRTVVSNIHKDGIPAVEAGAYIADLLVTILNEKASGVELKRGD